MKNKVLSIWSCLHHWILDVGQWLPFASRHAGEFFVLRRQALVVTFCLNSHNSRMPYEFSIRFSITKFIFVELEKDSVFCISVHSGFTQILFQFPFGAESYSICLFPGNFAVGLHLRLNYTK